MHLPNWIVIFISVLSQLVKNVKTFTLLLFSRNSCCKCLAIFAFFLDSFAFQVAYINSVLNVWSFIDLQPERNLIKVFLTKYTISVHRSIHYVHYLVYISFIVLTLVCLMKAFNLNFSEKHCVFI